MVSTSLRDLYDDEMKRLWSANDQMEQVVALMRDKARDAKLKQTLERSMTAIRKHAETLKYLLAAADDEERTPNHCKGMAGLVAEARKQLTQEAPAEGALLDLVIIAQYQRMSHYGLAGFGTAMAYAHAMGMPDHALRLQHIVTDIYDGEECASRLAERTESLAADMRP